MNSSDHTLSFTHNRLSLYTENAQKNNNKQQSISSPVHNQNTSKQEAFPCPAQLQSHSDQNVDSVHYLASLTLQSIVSCNTLMGSEIRARYLRPQAVLGVCVALTTAGLLSNPWRRQARTRKRCQMRHLICPLNESLRHSDCTLCVL